MGSLTFGQSLLTRDVDCVQLASKTLLYAFLWYKSWCIFHKNFHHDLIKRKQHKKQARNSLQNTDVAQNVKVK